MTGNTTVDIVGTNSGGVTAVYFGSTPSTLVTPVSPDVVPAVSPPAIGAGTVDVTVSNGSATSATKTADQFTYVTGPSIQKVSPHAGSTLGGNPVTIVGSGFTDASSVQFGTTPAASFTVQSDQEILAYTPSHAAGSVTSRLRRARGPRRPIRPTSTSSR